LRILKVDKILSTKINKSLVAIPSIRLRILKEVTSDVAFVTENDVAIPSIRLRILKEDNPESILGDYLGCNPLDPLEDTERIPEQP